MKKTKKWLEAGADGYTKDPRFAGKFPATVPVEAYEKLWKVWRGKIWRICITVTYENDAGEIVEDIDGEKSYFVYERPRHLFGDEKAVEVPALQHMIPLNQTHDKTELGVLLREQVDFATAWFGYDYAALNTDAGFHYNFIDEQRPFFKSDEELLELKTKTDYVSRDFYNTVVDILVEEYEKWETELFLFLQSMVKLVKQGHNENESQAENTFVQAVTYQ